MPWWPRYLAGPRSVGRMGLLICLLAIIPACAPAISKQVRQQVDQSLSFPVLASEPDQYKGKIVILGGIIAQTTPKPGQTELEIVQKPLDSLGEPQVTDTSGGRFLVIAESFLDPLIYRKDRRITVAGEVTGSEVRKLEELEYRYPVLKSLEMKLWPSPRAGGPMYWSLGYSFGWGSGPYGYWGWGPGLYIIP